MGEDRKDRKQHQEKKRLKANGTHNAQGAESNLSFIQLANEVRKPDTNRGLMVGENFSQRATLTQDFYSCLSLLLSVFFIQEESSTEERKGTEGRTP